MRELLGYLPYLWLAAISLAALVLTVYDKIAAKRLPGRRVPEKTLFIVSALGGSVMMYAVMQLIRHKTQHKCFMIGIPLIIALQLVLLIAALLLIR